MTRTEKDWIRKQLYRIWIIDNENDCQADDISDLLDYLAAKVGFSLLEYM